MAMPPPVRVRSSRISLVASSASAEQFSWQLSGGYGETELSPFADTERTMLDATYYLDPVDDTRGPYALAPFLNRSSRVTGGVSKETTTITVPVAYIGPLPPPGPTAWTSTEDTTGYTVGGRYVWSASGWYVGAAYRDLDTDQEQSSPLSRQGTTSDGYELFGGRYFGESTSLDLTAGTARQTTELTLTCITSLCLSGSTATQIDTDDWSIGALHVRQKPRLSYTIAGRVSGNEITPSVSPLVLTLAARSAAAATIPWDASAVVSTRFRSRSLRRPRSRARSSHSTNGRPPRSPVSCSRPIASGFGSGWRVRKASTATTSPTTSPPHGSSPARRRWSS